MAKHEKGFYFIQLYTGGPWTIGLYNPEETDYCWSIIGSDACFKTSELGIIDWKHPIKVR